MIHPKSALIERSKQLGFDKPQFDTKRTGSQHEPTFISDAILNGEVYGTGQGGTKRDAERHASEEALVLLDQNGQTPDKSVSEKSTSRNSKNVSKTSSKTATRQNGIAKNGVTSHGVTSHGATTNVTTDPVAANSTTNNVTTNKATDFDSGVDRSAHTHPAQAQALDDLFEGPWPLVPDVLATSLQIANNRVNPGAQGADAIREVHALAVELYKASLQSLGEVVEIDE
jgi:hypothetical protein